MALKVSWRDSMVKIRPGHGKSFVSSFNAKNYSETSLYYRVLYWISKLFIDSGSIDTAIDMGRVTDSILCGSFQLVNSLPTATCTIFPTRLGRFVFSYWWKFSGPATLVRWRHVTTTTSTHMNQKLLRWHQQLYLLILLAYFDSAYGLSW